MSSSTRTITPVSAISVPPTIAPAPKASCQAFSVASAFASSISLRNSDDSRLPRRANSVWIGGSVGVVAIGLTGRSEEHTSELQSLMRISYAVFCLKKKTHLHNNKRNYRYKKPDHQ